MYHIILDLFDNSGFCLKKQIQIYQSKIYNAYHQKSRYSGVITQPYNLLAAENTGVHPHDKNVFLHCQQRQCSHILFQLSELTVEGRRIQSNMQDVTAPDNRKRGIPARLPSFLRLTFRVMKDWTQQNSVPRPKVMDVPILCSSSSLDSLINKYVHKTN